VDGDFPDSSVKKNCFESRRKIGSVIECVIQKYF